LKLPSLPRFTNAELIFSVKCFAAAMLAVYLASWAGQPRPFWALITSYVVANPLAGMVRSRALFRFAGTLLGCTAAVLIVPLFSNSPELLSLAMSLWAAVCLYLSLQDRTPRSYVFMLAGYTAAMIGFPSVDTPLTIFDTGIARVEEIGLGIFSATVVHSLIWPTSLKASVLGLLDRTLGDTRRWMSDLLLPLRSPDASNADRRRVAGDITQLRLLSTHIPFDPTPLSWTTDAVHSVQDGVAALTPVLSALEDRLQALEQVEGGLAPDIADLLARIGQWLEQATVDELALDALRADILAFAAQAQHSDWSSALRIGLATRLDELVSGWHACLKLRQGIDHGLSGAPAPRAVRQTQGQILHLDQGMALLSACSVMVATLICCVFWVLTGWSSGSAAAMMAVIFSSFFAGMDDPVPAIHGFLAWTLWSIPVSAVYVLVLLPLVQDITTLAVVCAPVFLFVGAYVGRPATFGRALPALMGLCGTLSMHDTAQADLVNFLNSMLGQVFGILVAARVARLMRSVGAEWSARRIQRATWRDLDALASLTGETGDGPSYLLRMLDRISLLAPRIAQAGGEVKGVPVDDALRDLRLGADIVALQKAREQLPAEPLRIMLADLAGWFRLRINGRLVSPPKGLLPVIDEVLVAALSTPEVVGHAAIAALVGLRRNLFPAALPILNPVQEGAAT